MIHVHPFVLALLFPGFGWETATVVYVYLLAGLYALGVPTGLEGILEAFIAPDLRLIRDLGERGIVITRFLGRSYTEPGEMVQALIREQYEELGRRFMEVFARALPEVPQAELYWRFKFVVGVTTHIQADAGRTGEYAADPSDVDEMVGRLVAFLAAGLRAPVPAPQWQDRAKKGASW